MPSTLIQYRLRIRNAADSADAVTLTSHGGSAYLLEVPRIDGASFDPLTGVVSNGQANVVVADPLIGAGIRAFTQHLGDVAGDSQLLGRRAFLEISRTELVAFVPHFAGYIAGVRTVDAISYELSLVHTTRDDETSMVWSTIDYPNWSAVSRLLGGPVSATVPSFDAAVKVQEPQGFWSATVIAKYNTYLHLDINEDASGAFPPRDLARALRDRGGVRLSNNDQQRNVFRWAQSNAERYFERGYPNATAEAEWRTPKKSFSSSIIAGYLPRVRVQFLTKNGAMINHRAPMMASYAIPRMVDGLQQGTWESRCWEDLGNHFYVNWANTDPVAQPNPGDVLVFYAAPIDVSETSPAWLRAHPVTLLQEMLTYVGYTVDVTGLAAVQAAVGPVQVALRITEPRTVADAMKLLCGAFGLGVRSNADGTRTIFCWRTRKVGVPTITLDDLADTEAVWWATDEASQLAAVAWEWQRFQTWPGDAARTQNEDSRYQDARALDGVVAVEDAVTFAAADQPRPNAREQAYKLPGTLLGATGAPLRSITDVIATWSQQMFAVYAKGAVTTEINVLPSVTADIGDEVILSLTPRPGIFAGQTPTAQRNTPEQCLVIGRTPQAFGATLTLLRVVAVGPAPDGGDSDGPVFPALDTSFTVVPGSPSSTMIALDLVDDTGWLDVAEVEIEYAQQVLAPIAGQSGIRWDERWDTVTAPFEFGPFTGERKVWVRIRAVLVGGGSEGPWTAWQLVTLTAGGAPGGIVQAPAIRWALDAGTGDLDVMLETDANTVAAYCLARTDRFPTTAEVLATTPEATPFAFPAVLTISGTQFAYIAAIAEDAVGARSIPAYSLTTSLMGPGGGGGGVAFTAISGSEDTPTPGLYTIAYTLTGFVAQNISLRATDPNGVPVDLLISSIDATSVVFSQPTTPSGTWLFWIEIDDGFTVVAQSISIPFIV